MAAQVLSSMLRINRQRRLALRRALAPYGYVGSMHLIVLYTSRTPGASQEEIACFYALDKGSVARDARRLEDMGHIRRETVPSNRRQYQLFLTEEGLGMVEVLDRAFEQFQSRLSAALSPEDWQVLTALLEQLEAAVSPAPEKNRSPGD